MDKMKSLIKQRFPLLASRIYNLLKVLKKIPGTLVSNVSVASEYLNFKMRKTDRFKLDQLRSGFADSVTTPESSYFLDDLGLQRIISAYQSSKRDQARQPIEYQIGGEWNSIINKIYGDLSNQIEQGELEAVRATLSNFAKDKISLGLSAYGAITKGYFKDLETLNFYNTSYRIWKNLTGLGDEALVFPRIGNLHGMKYDDAVVTATSFRLSYFAYRIKELLSGDNSGTPSVLEIGGGYGGLAYFLLRNGNSNIRYMNVDIPENNMIVSFFLMSAFPKKKVLLYGETADDDYDIAIMPNFYIKQVPDKSIDLVFNSHSLTEMSEEAVKEYLQQIDRIGTKYFLHANHEGNPDSYGTKYKHVNLNDPEFGLRKSAWKRIYRLPETLANVSLPNKRTLFTFWEYLYEKC